MRALLLVLDSVGVGGAPDAASYGDEGAHTLGHILKEEPTLALPALRSLGLDSILDAGGVSPSAVTARLRESSAGKDTTTGHWELAGAIIEEPFATFERFPDDLVRALENAAGVDFIGNCVASGTEILEKLGEEHLSSGRPILYTSADSVLQIAAHEGRFGLQRLYDVCQVARSLSDPYRIGRVIARPFVGAPGNFARTPNRHDYSLVPPHTVLNALQDSGTPVIGVGKISDIFATSGISESHPTRSNADGMTTIERLWQTTTDGLIFANLVDFDMLFGHRRDTMGYANALEVFDKWIDTFLPNILPADLLLITADHGNDPTWKGTDHTREEVPLILLHGDRSGYLGTRAFADVAATIAQHFGLPPWPVGKPL